MSTLREAAQALCDEIEQDLADGKAFNASTVGAAKALRAELAKPDAPAVRRVEAYTYASTQATNCAGCGEYKHTPLRIDAMDGYVCLTCIDKKLGSLLGEFGYPEPEPAPAEPQPAGGDALAQAGQGPVAWWRVSYIEEDGSSDADVQIGANRPTSLADNGYPWRPLFAHPPTAKPLTDERIDRILDALPEGCCNQITGAEARVFARAIEASITATKGEP